MHEWIYGFTKKIILLIMNKAPKFVLIYIKVYGQTSIITFFLRYAILRITQAH